MLKANFLHSAVNLTHGPVKVGDLHSSRTRICSREEWYGEELWSWSHGKMSVGHLKHQRWIGDWLHVLELKLSLNCFETRHYLMGSCVMNGLTSNPAQFGSVHISFICSFAFPTGMIYHVKREKSLITGYIRRFTFLFFGGGVRARRDPSTCGTKWKGYFLFQIFLRLGFCTAFSSLVKCSILMLQFTSARLGLP